MLQTAFVEHFKSGKFFPRPADIQEIIRKKREAKFAKDYQAIDWAATEREQSTPEWQESAARAREALKRLAAGKAMK